jgi:choice-of-anchor B domain-containing protein
MGQNITMIVRYFSFLIFIVAVSPTGAFESLHVTLKRQVTLAEITPFFSSTVTMANDCWGYTSPSGRKYSIMGLQEGVVFIEISDPENPTIIAGFDGVSTLWRDIKVYSTYAYVGADGIGADIEIYDLSQIDTGVVQKSNTVITQASHNIAIDTDSGFLYQCGSSIHKGFEVFDLNTNPGNPPSVGYWNNRYFHDLQVVTYTSGPYNGKQIAFCFASNNHSGSQPGLDILDVTDKNNIIQYSSTLYPNGNYSHQGWLSPDNQYLYLGDEGDESNGLVDYTTTLIFNVASLSAPILENSYNNGSLAIGHNMYTKDHFLFQANYTSGLRVLDISDNVYPIEVAWFDTYPANNYDSFNGLWNVFPYFADGIIIGSDVAGGLFVWEFNYDLGAFRSLDQLAMIGADWGTTYTISDLIAFSDAWLIEKWDQVRHWTFDNTSGPVVTHVNSVDNLQGELHFFPTNDSQWVTGILGGALMFDGLNDYISANSVCGDIAGGDFSLSIWVKSDEITVKQFFASFNTITGGNRLHLGHDTGSANLSLHDSGYFDTGVVVFDGIWHHIILTFNELGDRATVYVDGVEVLIHSTTTSIDPTDHFTIGQKYDPGSGTKITSDFYGGVVDDLHIYNRELTPAEIATLWP